MRYSSVILGSFLFITDVMYCCCSCGAEKRTKADKTDSPNSIEGKQKGEISQNPKNKDYIIDIRDFKRYEIVKIGTQIWFAENLAYKPLAGNFWAYDDNNCNIASYGYLYNYETAKNCCPTGWHLPGNEEWLTLINFFGGKSIAGSSLKAINGWNSPNTGATISSGFNALPGGNRSVGGTFYHIGNHALLWSGTKKSILSVWRIRLNYDNASVGLDACGHNTGLSVRCIKD